MVKQAHAKESGVSIDRAWWLKRGDDLAEAVEGVFSILKTQSPARSSKYLTLLSLYKNQHLGSGTSYGGIHAGFGTSSLVGNARNNIIQTRVDAVNNRISKHRPRPTFTPRGGNHSIRRRAKLLKRYVDSMIDSLKLDRMAPRVVKDGEISGMGIVKPWRVGSEIRLSRTMECDIFVDELEASHDKVEQLFERTIMSRSAAMYEFVDHPLKMETIGRRVAAKRKKAIAGAAVFSEEHVQTTMVGDPIEVVESWHLPSGKEAHDGYHTIIVPGAVLFEEEYTQDEFPHCFFRWSSDPTSFFSQGLAERLVGCHIKANHLEDRTEECVDINASPYVWVDRASNVSASEIDDVPGTVREYSGRKPEVDVVNAIPPEFLGLMDRIEQRADGIARLTFFGSGSTQPASLQTGSAVREWNDADAEGFSLVLAEYENLYLDVSRKIVRLTKEAYEEDSSLTVVAHRDRNSISEVRWEEVDLEEGQYSMQVQPTSSLPNSVPQRIAAATTLFNSGAFDDKADFLRALNLPDTEGALDKMTAEIDHVDRMIERILDDGEPQFLEPFVNPDTVMARVPPHYYKAIDDGVEETYLVLLRKLWTQASDVIQARKAQAVEEAQAMAMAQAGMGAQPTHSPGAPPTIDEQGQNPLATQQGGLQ